MSSEMLLALLLLAIARITFGVVLMANPLNIQKGVYCSTLLKDFSFLREFFILLCLFKAKFFRYLMHLVDLTCLLVPLKSCVIVKRFGCSDIRTMTGILSFAFIFFITF